MKFCFNKKAFIEGDIAPQKLAVIGDDFEMTWFTFEERVNQFCIEFELKGWLDLNSPVIIYGHKSANMMVAIYAMMQMEIAYIPIDIIYPKDRVSKIVSSAKVDLIINTNAEDFYLEGTFTINLFNTDVEFPTHPSNVLEGHKNEDPLVYIIFTSGSTGEPKGVQISTEAVQSFTRWMGSSDFKFGAGDVFVNTALLSFDLSVFEVMTFGHLGATLLLNSKAQSSEPNQLMDRINKYNGTVWVSTPSFALSYARIENEERLNTLSTFLFCGEVLPHGLAKQLLDNFKGAKVLNTYGPTEATVATTIVEITTDILTEYDPLPVGKSKMESELLIEDEEIVIVGANVSLGYLNNANLNREKFSKINGKRAFKTGDKGYLKNGMLFFHGRNDDLVKLHGYRIELNEITSALNNLHYIIHGETIALKRGDTVKKIVSIVEIDNTELIDSARIKLDLAKTLPAYMIPSGFKLVDKIPLNQNGKADKKLLTALYMKR